jgi:glycosyltransferase involved in cell wall biosynthesis
LPSNAACTPAEHCSARRLSASVIIPTRDRPEDLRKCVQSLVAQTRLPEEIVVVDDGTLDPAPLISIAEAAGVHFLYIPKEGPPGQARSRNIGVARSSGDIVFFLDDDVVLESDYLDAILRLYEADTEEKVGGIGGVIVNDPHIGPARALAEMLRGTPCWGHGRVFACGFNQMNYHAVRRVQPVQWLGGGVSSFRRPVMEQFRFAEHYRDYTLFEDAEHSYRVSHKYQLLITPEARLYHYPSPVRWYDPEGFAAKQVVNLGYHFRRNMPQRLYNKLAFSWYLAAMLLTDVVRLVLMPHRIGFNWARLKGHLRGIRQHLSSPLPPSEDA